MELGLFEHLLAIQDILDYGGKDLTFFRHNSEKVRPLTLATFKAVP